MLSFYNAKKQIYLFYILLLCRNLLSIDFSLVASEQIQVYLMAS